MKYKVIILLGRSGCGKGTQAKELANELGYTVVGSGELLRAETEKDTFTGRKLKESLKGGNLAPVFLVSKLWSEKAEDLYAKRVKGILIDGSPRKLLEAKLMDSIFKWYEWKTVRVILLDISEKEAYDRLTKRRICTKCGKIIPWVGDFKDLDKCPKCDGSLKSRSDDTKEAIKSRLEFYNTDVAKVVEYYRRKKILIKVDGGKTIQEVHKEIMSKIS